LRVALDNIRDEFIERLDVAAVGRGFVAPKWA
jgi:hypothetical protein